jgi:hypothetical protein
MSTAISDLPFNAAAPPTPTVPTTPLPERDIPRQTITHTTDPQSMPGYMPPRVPDYIPQPPPMAKLDYSRWMEELRVPILLAVLFFVFNTAGLQSFLQRMLPLLKDSAHSEMIKSALFGLFYYAVTTGMDHFTKQ